MYGCRSGSLQFVEQGHLDCIEEQQDGTVRGKIIERDRIPSGRCSDCSPHAEHKSSERAQRSDPASLYRPVSTQEKAKHRARLPEAAEYAQNLLLSYTRPWAALPRPRQDNTIHVTHIISGHNGWAFNHSLSYISSF
jgi:hypothetical protein